MNSHWNNIGRFITHVIKTNAFLTTFIQIGLNTGVNKTLRSFNVLEKFNFNLKSTKVTLNSVFKHLSSPKSYVGLHFHYHLYIGLHPNLSSLVITEHFIIDLFTQAYHKTLN